MKRLLLALGILLWLAVPAGATAPTKARTSLWSAQILTAAAGDTTSSTINLSATFESQVDIVLTNGATGPTVAAQVQVWVANDSGATLFTKYGGALQCTSTNSDVCYFSVTLPIGVAAMKLVAGSNTGQNVTVDADISSVTAIAMLFLSYRYV